MNSVPRKVWRLVYKPYWPSAALGAFVLASQGIEMLRREHMTIPGRPNAAVVSIETTEDAFAAGDMHEVLKACMVASFLEGDEVEDDEPFWLPQALAKPGIFEGV